MAQWLWETRQDALMKVGGGSLVLPFGQRPPRFAVIPADGIEDGVGYLEDRVPPLSWCRCRSRVLGEALTPIPQGNVCFEIAHAHVVGIVAPHEPVWAFSRHVGHLG